jgi:hypothetical protein
MVTADVLLLVLSTGAKAAAATPGSRSFATELVGCGLFSGFGIPIFLSIQ